MRYVVRVVYPDDWNLDAHAPAQYNEWLSFHEGEESLMIQAMANFIRRRYRECPIQERKEIQELQHRGVLHFIEVPHFSARLPDGSVISVFFVEVVF